jgi:hypothetical protein
MLIPVDDTETLEAVKRLVLIKKKPNRKPFPRSSGLLKMRHAMRFVHPLHGRHVSEAFREELRERLTRVYGIEDGHALSPLYTASRKTSRAGAHMRAEKAPRQVPGLRGLPCPIAPVVSSRIEPKRNAADDVTWAILPYVPNQYGN